MWPVQIKTEWYALQIVFGFHIELFALIFMEKIMHRVWICYVQCIDTI